MFYVESPFQLLQVFELIQKDRSFSKKSILVRLNKVKKNNEQLFKIIKTLNIKNTWCFDANIANLFLAFLMLFRSSLFGNKIFFGDSNAKFFKYSKPFLISEIVVLDDGVATLNAKNENFARFTIFKNIPKSIINNFSNLKKYIDKKTKKVVRPVTIVVGSDLVESKIMRSNEYLQFIESAVLKSEGDIFYFPHRKERIDYLLPTLKKYNIELLHSDLPIELVALEIGFPPKKIISMFSTSLFSLAVIYSEAEIMSLRVCEKSILIRKKQIQNIYKSIEKDLRIKLINI